VDQLSTSVAGITSWQMHGYGKKNTTIKGNFKVGSTTGRGYEISRPIQFQGNRKVGSTKGEVMKYLDRSRKPLDRI
jgi:hypothetical protein